MDKKMKKLLVALSIVIALVVSGDAFFKHQQGQVSQSIVDHLSSQANSENNK